MRWLLAVVLASGCVARSPIVALVAEPRAELTSTVYDFGSVPIGEEVRHVFPVRNGGRKPLTLVPGRKECACTSAVSPGGTVAAGDAGWVEVAFATKGAGGKRARTVTIETNDPERPELVLTLRGTVRVDVNVSPDRVFFGRVPRGASRQIEVDIATAPGVAIEKIRKDSRRFRLRVEQGSASGAGIRLILSLNPQRRRGPFDDTVILETSSARQSTIELPVFGLIE
ncbi:MAG: DUF1573 domain-containing protein [Candidatus Binatia bacterium]|nr:DUF1573 domain-containing protein [Candidatus Binatia bacterium]